MNSTAMAPIDWYFDFISPFAYLQWQRLQRQAPARLISPKPILFAGLLKHWDNKGPVEIAPKRDWTYAHCLWIAHRYGIAMTLPSQHPFNPLPLLRLCIALDCQPAVIDRLFDYVWRDGCVPTDTAAWMALLQELRIDAAALDDPAIKARLKSHGDQAIAAGVFGVPTAVVDGHNFWGVDATDMLHAFVQGDPFFSSAEFQRIASLPSGMQRKLA